MKGDLHVHTNVSDGSFTIEETLELAKKNKVTHLGICNHDTVKNLGQAVELGKVYGISVIPGIEISAYDYINNRKVHILGYNFNMQGENIQKVCNPILINRNKNSIWQIKKLIENGYDLDIFAIKKRSQASGVIYKQHIMEELIKKHYTDGIYSDLYRRLFKNNGICAKDIEYVDVFKAIEAIKDDGGMAILAHPGQLNSYDIIEKLVDFGLDGIEINHHSHTDEDIVKIQRIAKRLNLILTGGTDFHGNYGSLDINIGDLRCPEEYLKFF